MKNLEQFGDNVVPFEKGQPSEGSGSFQDIDGSGTEIIPIRKELNDSTVDSFLDSIRIIIARAVSVDKINHAFEGSNQTARNKELIACINRNIENLFEYLAEESPNVDMSILLPPEEFNKKLREVYLQTEALENSPESLAHIDYYFRTYLDCFCDRYTKLYEDAARSQNKSLGDTV